MPKKTLKGTRDIPLRFAKNLTKIVNEAWEDGTLIQNVSPITQDLFKILV